jgi:hypothetical protein
MWEGQEIMKATPANMNIDPLPPELRKQFGDDPALLRMAEYRHPELHRDRYMEAREELGLPEELTPREEEIVAAIDDYHDRFCCYDEIMRESVEMAHEICAAAGWINLPPEIDEHIKNIWELAQKGCRIPDGLG